jgi:adenine-specific DNA-methyltransferase
LVWAGKAERTSFEVPTVSLHVHERIDPRTIVEAVRRRNGSNDQQMSLFQSPEENPPLREAIEFYKHPHNWSNRLIAGDSLLVMNSLIEKEGMAGQVQMIYIDPPYGIRYGSNFQPFVNKRDVKDGKDEDLTQEPETIKAFRDTWELGIHSYITYLRDRLLLARELLTESGSIFVQISDENVHHIRELMDEVFRTENFLSLITFQKTTSASGTLISSVSDYIIWYAKDAARIKTRALFFEREGEGWVNYDYLRLQDGTYRRMTSEERADWSRLPKGADVYRRDNLTSQRPAQGGDLKIFEFEGKEYRPGKGTFKTDRSGLERLQKAGRLEAYGETLAYRRFAADFPYRPMSNLWTDTLTGGFAEERYYVVQTIVKVIQRCLLMTTDPGDLVVDLTCGSGTTAFVAEQWGRRWITCDTSRVALTLAKQRLMTAVYDYYELAHPHEGVGSGFKYKTVPHITLRSITNNEPTEQEVLYDQPFVDNSRTRITGPFTVEAVPAPVVKPLVDIKSDQPADESIARSGETLRQAEWRDELLKSGIRGKKGQYILFSRVEPLPATRWLHAEAETKPNEKGADRIKDPEGIYGKPQRVVISFGPEHAPLEQKQVELAIEEAQTLVPKPKIIVFAAFQFDPEAAKDIDETDWPGVTLLKVQMNADLLTEDLKKKRASNESFWLIGQPDIVLKKIKDGDHKGKYRVEVMGFDYYNTKTGTIESGGNEKIAIWMLDADYDGRSLLPRQVFFPMAGENDGWARLARNLKAEIDEELIEKYRGTVSLPFEPGKHKRAAVKIVDDRGIESLKLLDLPA